MRLALSILDMAARLLFALGVGCLLLGAYLSWRTLDFARDAARATGEVVGYHETRDGDDTRYRPRVRFTTASGEIVTIAGQLAAGSKRFAVGEKVPVVYKVSRPTEARISLFTDNWLGAAIAAVIGLAGLAGGYLVRRSVRQELMKRP
ncbi:MAG TPA: DUF3592 domain-containing protein [Steroidobacteraceae bacterium]|nr:DUF3592 domain-containing protein [Steroidobacteraceae bacterium]